VRLTAAFERTRRATNDLNLSTAPTAALEDAAVQTLRELSTHRPAAGPAQSCAPESGEEPKSKRAEGVCLRPA